MAERRVEQIKYEVEIVRIAALATVAIGGGTVGLFIGEMTQVRVFFAVFGLLMTGGLLLALWRRHRAIRRQISALEEERVWRR